MTKNRRLFLAFGLAFAAAGLFVLAAEGADWISTASGSERPLAKAPLATARGTDLAGLFVLAAEGADWISTASGSERPLAKAPLATARGTDFAQDPAKQESGPEPVVYVCPMHPDVNSKLPGQCHKCNMKLVESKAGAGADFHICPMHPDVVSNQGGTCPKCNMKLVKTEPPEISEYIVRIKTNPAPPKAGQNVKLQFSIFHPVTEKQIKDFNILHDMPFHLFVVSQDFEVFQHIHPDKQPDGSFTIETDLPKAGYYKIFCDFFPAGGMPQVTHHNLVTAGYNGDLISSQAKLRPDKPIDGKFIRTVEGTRFELKFDPEEPFCGKPAELHYHLVDEKTGEPVKDLKPYLGAWGHTLILSEDATDYLHSHPTEMIPDGVDRSKLESKSDVVFDTFFPRPGNYRIWSQFQRGDKIITVPFTVHVPRLK